METLKLILASSVVSIIVSTVISYLISIRLKKIDFKNEYYKEILKKRLTAYEFIEKQISIFKAVVLDDDKRAYHIIFSFGESNYLEHQNNLFLAVSNSLWIDRNTCTKLEEMNDLFFSINKKAYLKSNTEIIEIGKQYYQRISDLRFQLEGATKYGLYNLHDIEKAFKTKRTTNEKRIIYNQ